jgi:hypothetical protein
VSHLALRGLSAVGPVDVSSGFPTFAIDYSAPPITIDTVNAHRD